MVDLKTALNNLLTNAHGHPLGKDEFRTVYATDLDELSQYYKENFMEQTHTAPICQRCCASISPEGFCRDETCPYSSYSQDVPKELFDEDVTTLDIFDACVSLGILIKIDPERLADNDLFECEDCGYAFEIEDSVQRNVHLYCPSCAAYHLPK
jgi:hypothetical protein